MHSYDWLSFIERRLPPARRAAAEKHLAQCPACQADLNETAELADTLAALPRALERWRGQPAAGWPQVLARLRRRAVGYPWWRLAVSASMLALGLSFSSTWLSAAVATVPWPGERQTAAAWHTPLRPPALAAVQTNPNVTQMTVTPSLSAAAPLAIPAQTPRPLEARNTN